LGALIFQDLCDILRVEFSIIVRASETFSDLFQEFAEVYTNWQINEHISVYSSEVSVLFIDLDVAELLKHAKRVSSAHHFFIAATTLGKTSNDADHVINLVAVKNTSNKLIQRKNSLTLQVA